MHKIFLSHGAADAELAEYVEHQLVAGDSLLTVFRATRVGQIPAGKEWLAYVKGELRSSDRYLVLLTPWSMSRSWVVFETGAAWMTERTLVPVVAGGLDKSAVVEPIGSLQLLSLEKPAEAEQAFADLGSHLADSSTFASTVIGLAAKGMVAASADEGWEGVELNGTLYAWEGPMEGLHKGHPRPFTRELLDALQAAGQRATVKPPSDPAKVFAKGYKLLYAIDKKFSRRHMLIDEHGQALFVRPLGTD